MPISVIKPRIFWALTVWNNSCKEETLKTSCPLQLGSNSCLYSGGLTDNTTNRLIYKCQVCGSSHWLCSESNIR